LWHVDEDANMLEDEDTVVVPDWPALLRDEEHSLLLQAVDPLAPSPAFGVDLYLQAVELVHGIIQSRSRSS
jgi:hypothetical protein